MILVTWVAAQFAPRGWRRVPIEVSVAFGRTGRHLRRRFDDVLPRSRKNGRNDKLVERAASPCNPQVIFIINAGAWGTLVTHPARTVHTVRL